MIASLVLLALIGGRPAEPAGMAVEPGLPWSSQAGLPPGPRISTPIPGEDAGWRFAFEAGIAASAGLAQIPLPGDLLYSQGVRRVDLEYRMKEGGPLDVVLFAVQGIFRAPLTSTGGSWRRVALEFADFAPEPGREISADRVRLRYVRIESPVAGLAAPCTVDVRSVEFVRTGLPVTPPAPRMEAVTPAESLRAGPVVEGGRAFFDREPTYPLGVFLLGGNRSLMERVAQAGANMLVEYGPAAWPLETVEDYLDYAHASGMRVAAALTVERPGTFEEADARLVRLHRHPALGAWYLFDEPDGGPGRGLDPAACTPDTLRARADWLGETPVMITCLDAFGLRRYADVAEMLATDLYWPACGPDHSAAVIHSAAEATVEIAEGRGALPLIVLQLAHPDWSASGRATTPEAMRAQMLSALAAGVRGIFFFQGVAALRPAAAGEAEGRLWRAFLELSGEAAALGPLAARWNRLPGEPLVEPALGEVRAACFEEGGERWIVMVNLGRKPSEVLLTGACLEGAAALADPRDGWRAEVEGGAWRGRLAPFDGRVVRVVPAGDVVRRAPAVESILPAWTIPPQRRIVNYDRVIVGATLFPAPQGPVKLFVDGIDRTAETAVHRGAAAVVRCAAHHLSPGPHTVRLVWRHGGLERETSWSFQVRRQPLPFADGFDRDALGDSWSPVEGLLWNWFDPDEVVGRGTIELEGGGLHVRSVAGSVGALLRKVEAPERFTMRFDARLPRDGAVLIERNELFLRVPVPAGRHTVTLQESPQGQKVLVDGVVAGRWTPPVDHRGGAIALGVPGGGEAWFDEVRIEPR